MTSETRQVSSATVGNNPNKMAVIAMSLLIMAAYVIFTVTLMRNLASLLPNEFTIAAFGKTKTIHNIVERVANIVSTALIMLPIGLWIEALVVGWHKSSIYRILFARTPSIELDLACLVAGQAQIFNVIRWVLTFGLAAFAGKWINGQFTDLLGFTKTIGTLPILVQIVFFYFVYTFFDYWDHRIEHTRIFWPFHRFHHSAQDFCMVTTMRQHPAAFVSIFVINLPMAILGASTAVMIYVNIAVFCVGMLQHSNIDSNLGFIGKYIFQAPVYHRKHHILDLSEGVGHFGMMPLWDHIFGTWKGEADQTLVIGVEKPYAHGFNFFKDIIRDYADFWRGLFGAKVDPYDF